MVDIDNVLKNVIKKGKVEIGARQTKLALNDGKAKMIIMSNNCPYSSEIDKLAKGKKTPLYQYKSNSIDLGHTCGKAFAVSVFAVLDDGGSNIMNLVKKR